MGRKNQPYDVIVTENPLLRGMRGRVTRSQVSGVRARMESGRMVDLEHSEFDYISEGREIKIDEIDEQN